MGTAPADGADGDVRLKAEFMDGELNDCEGAAGAGAGAEGIERSRRSFIPEAGAAGFDGADAVKPPKSPRPPDELILLCCAWACGCGFGLASKKFPPPPNIFDDDVVAGDFVLEKLSRPENGDGFGAGAALKERLLKASFMPPNADCCGDVCCCC